MNRRGHLSTKIPNAKNRPAPIGASRRKDKEREKSPLNAMDLEMLDRAWAGAEEEGSSSSTLLKSSKPWRGVVMTFTGVDNKPRLTEMATQLGATVEPALTIHVTHVIASGFNSAKYLYAVEHRIPILTPSWIQVAHANYLAGEEWDDHELAQSHRLLPFVGLKIAMSGIEPMDKRKNLIRYIEEYGGEYSKDLDRTCTHLIAAKYTAERGQSEKVKWALKELASREMARKNGKEVEGEDLRIVYEEWIWDCVGHGGRWKEDHYDAKKTRRTGKVKPEDVMNGVEFSPSVPPVPIDEAEAEPAMIKKRKRGDLDSLVGDIVSSAGGATRENGIKVEATRADLLAPDTSDIGESSRSPSADVDIARIPSRPGRPEKKPSMVHISRTASFGGVKKESLDVVQSLPPTGGPSVVTSVIREDGNGHPQIFAGMRIGHVIEEECEGLEKALVVHGGTFVTREERLDGADVDYLIVRLTSTTLPDVSHLPNPPQIVTECWIEGCCYEKRLLPLDSHIVFRPLPAPMPVPGSERLIVHLSSLSIENAVYMKRLVRALGGTLSLKLNKQTTHLVTGSTSGQKVDKAREWGLKIVKDSWLVAMAKSGHLEDESSHEIELSIPTHDRKPVTNSSRDAPQIMVAASSQSSRALRPTPTHIDDAPYDSLVKSESASSLSKALSPPKASTHRLLNSATTLRSPPRHDADKSDSIESKLSRTSSAPPANLSKGKEQRVNSHLEPQRKEEISALLRSWEGKGGSSPDPTAVQKQPIRRRPTSRLKSTTLPYPSFNTSPSSGNTSFDNSGLEAVEESVRPVEADAGQESMRVYHRDVEAEKAAKKIRDAMTKASKIVEDSPAKRLRTAR